MLSMLSPEIRVQIYENLLIRPGHNFHVSRRQRSFAFGKNARPISTNILRTCRSIYNEALPTLYGNNIICFDDHAVDDPVFPFPGDHLPLLKHVGVFISPYRYGSTEKMGDLLQALANPGIWLLGLNIQIRIIEDADNIINEGLPASKRPDILHRFLFGENPIVDALFLFTTVKKLIIRMWEEARFEPGMAEALEYAFINQGIVDGRSITIEKGCTLDHWELSYDFDRCPLCCNSFADLKKGTASWKYEVDDITWVAVDEWRSMGLPLMTDDSEDGESTDGGGSREGLEPKCDDVGENGIREEDSSDVGNEEKGDDNGKSKTKSDDESFNDSEIDARGNEGEENGPGIFDRSLHCKACLLPPQEDEGAGCCYK